MITAKLLLDADDQIVKTMEMLAAQGETKIFLELQNVRRGITNELNQLAWQENRRK